jgi:hypothetical protein
VEGKEEDKDRKQNTSNNVIILRVLLYLSDTVRVTTFEH